MKRCLLAIFGSSCLGCVSVVSAAETSATVEVGLATAYVFRGLKEGELTAHPALEVSSGDFYGGVYSIVPLTDRGGRFGYHDEFELYAGYGWAVGDRTALDAGGTYRFRPDGGSSFECYLGARQEYGTLSPSLYIYRDFQFDTTTLEVASDLNAPIENLPFTFSVFLGRALAAGPRDYTYYGAGALYPIEVNDATKVSLGLRYVGNDLGGAYSRNHIYGTAAFSLDF